MDFTPSQVNPGGSHIRAVQDGLGVRNSSVICQQLRALFRLEFHVLPRHAPGKISTTRRLQATISATMR